MRRLSKAGLGKKGAQTGESGRLRQRHRSISSEFQWCAATDLVNSPIDGWQRAGLAREIGAAPAWSVGWHARWAKSGPLWARNGPARAAWQALGQKWPTSGQKWPTLGQKWPSSGRMAGGGAGNGGRWDGQREKGIGMAASSRVESHHASSESAACTDATAMFHTNAIAQPFVPSLGACCPKFQHELMHAEGETTRSPPPADSGAI